MTITTRYTNNLTDPSPLLSEHAREALAKTATGFNGGAFVGFAACDGPPCNAGQAMSGVATGYSGVLAVDSCLYRSDPALCAQDLVRFGSNVVATVVANRFPLVGQYLNLAWAGYGFVAGFVDARTAYAAGIEKFRTASSPALVGVTLK